jgi:DHA1 family bicyclomycin/chloramphenicol resistance-like MFS transporter
MVLSRSVVRDLFEEHDAARLFSILMLVMGVAPITAPLIGGQIMLVASWRAIFWVLTGFGVLCLAMVALALPESLPAERRSGAGPVEALATYARLLADRRFMGYALAGGMASAAMFAYIAGSPFVFIEHFGVPPQQYGWLFGANALGLIAASQLNGWLLGRYRSGVILGAALATQAAAGLLLAGVAALGLGGLPALLGPLFLCVASLGLIAPNATASAMAPHGRSAGSASALLGAIQFGAGAASGALVGALSNGTALPMAGVIAACALTALLSLTLLSERPVARPATPR